MIFSILIGAGRLVWKDECGSVSCSDSGLKISACWVWLASLKLPIRTTLGSGFKTRARAVTHSAGNRQSHYSSTATRGDMVVPPSIIQQWWSDFVNRVALVWRMSGVEMLYSWSESFIDGCIWLKCHEKCPDKFSGVTSDLIQRNQLNSTHVWSTCGGYSTWWCSDSEVLDVEWAAWNTHGDVP